MLYITQAGQELGGESSTGVMQHCQGSGTRMEARGRGAAGPNLGFAAWPLGIKHFINPCAAALESTCSGRALLSWDIQTSGGIEAGHQSVRVLWPQPAMKTYGLRRIHRPKPPIIILKNKKNSAVMP